MGAMERDPATMLAGPRWQGARLEWAYQGTMSKPPGAGPVSGATQACTQRLTTHWHKAKTFALGATARLAGLRAVHPWRTRPLTRTQWATALRSAHREVQGGWITVRRAVWRVGYAQAGARGEPARPGSPAESAAAHRHVGVEPRPLVRRSLPPQLALQHASDSQSSI